MFFANDIGGEVAQAETFGQLVEKLKALPVDHDDRTMEVTIVDGCKTVGFVRVTSGMTGPRRVVVKNDLLDEIREKS